MSIDQVQDYCDWCMGPLSAESRARSRWLGLSTEHAWACSTCLRTGDYRVPPDGWDGPVGEWLAADQYVLGPDDVEAVVNALREILDGPNAVPDADFQLRIGVSRADARQTLRRFSGSP
ncbi:hypothetical protein ACIG47_02500 [Promicromonospora sp. NPDC052451]|uniref:hypothetical protein n=1 Tax=unclassified Promicromonospora TaxID=2647929 RepID=UPI0037C728BF